MSKEMQNMRREYEGVADLYYNDMNALRLTINELLVMQPRPISFCYSETYLGVLEDSSTQLIFQYFINATATPDLEKESSIDVNRFSFRVFGKYFPELATTISIETPKPGSRNWSLAFLLRVFGKTLGILPYLVANRFYDEKARTLGFRIFERLVQGVKWNIVHFCWRKFKRFEHQRSDSLQKKRFK